MDYVTTFCTEPLGFVFYWHAYIIGTHAEEKNLLKPLRNIFVKPEYDI